MRQPKIDIRRLFTGPSVHDELVDYNGAGPGFDFWRFFLSSSVIFLHSFHVSYGIAAGGDKIRFLDPVFAMILPIFFGLSGFLVAGSAIRTASIKVFLSYRALRLVPALAVEVALSALILGPMLSISPLSTYFTSRSFFSYWGNIVGFVHYQLPGMFLNNPVPGTINKNLWTLHAELECYVIIALAMAFGLLKRRYWAILLWACATIVMVALSMNKGWFIRSSLFPPPLFVYSFCTGVVAFLWRDRITLTMPSLVLALITYFVLYQFQKTSVVAIIPLVYVMIWVGMNEKFRFPVLKKGDYSYGLYLYGFVIQQTLVLLLPGWRDWWFIFPASIFLTLCFAITSWHLIEKPALSLKKLVAFRQAAVASDPHPHEQRRQELLRLEEGFAGMKLQ